MSQPNPALVAQKLREAIQSKRKVEDLLYEALRDATVQVGPITFHVWGEFNKNLKEYSEAWLVLTSTQGRKWIRNQLDYLLDYVEYLIQNG